MANIPSDKKVQRYEKFSKAQRSIEHEHAKIHDGNAYSFSVQSSVTNAGSYTILLRTPVSYFPHYRVVRFRPEDGPFMVSLYKGVGVNTNSLGSAVISQNMKTASTNTTSLVVRSQAYIDVGSLGTLLEKELVPSTGVQGGGVDSPTPFEWILDESTDYAIVFENQSGSNTQLTYTSFFYET